MALLWFLLAAFVICCIGQQQFFFGGQVWADISAWGYPIDRYSSIISRVQPSFGLVRWSIPGGGGHFNKVAPVNATNEEMDNYVSSYWTASSWKVNEDTYTMLKSFNLTIVGIVWSAPPNYCSPKDNVTLLQQHVNDFAQLWSSIIIILQQHNIYIDYAELLNEPDGNWDTYASPTIYAQIINSVYNSFKQRGITQNQVGIIGPGLFSLSGSNIEEYVAAMDKNGVCESLSMWSSHAYDDLYEPSQGPSYLNSAYLKFLDAINNVQNEYECNHSIIITEWGVSTDVLNGKKYTHDVHNCYEQVSTTSDAKYSDAEGNVDTYGVRTLSYLLLAMNNGMMAASLWEIQDQHWDCQCYGLVDRNNQTVPNMVVLQTFLKQWSTDSVVIKRIWNDTDFVKGGVYSKSNNEYVISAANVQSQFVNEEFVINNNQQLYIVKAMIFNNESANSHTYSVNIIQTSFNKNSGENIILLPMNAQSTISVVLNTDSTNKPYSCGIIQNVNFIEQDLTSIISIEPTDCCDICRNTNQCQTFTWTNYNNGTCWLKKAFKSSQDCTPPCWSGYISA